MSHSTDCNQTTAQQHGLLGHLSTSDVKYEKEYVSEEESLPEITSEALRMLCWATKLNSFSGKQSIIYCDTIQKIKSSECSLCLWQFIHTIITVQLCNCFYCAALQPPILSNFLKMGPNATLEYDSGFALPWNQQTGGQRQAQETAYCPSHSSM